MTTYTEKGLLDSWYDNREYDIHVPEFGIKEFYRLADDGETGQPQTLRDFADYLVNTLAPDLEESGQEQTASDVMEAGTHLQRVELYLAEMETRGDDSAKKLRVMS